MSTTPHHRALSNQVDQEEVYGPQLPSELIYGPEPMPDGVLVSKTYSISEESPNFANTVKSIKESICTNGVYVPWVEFVIKDTLVGDFKITTDDANKCFITNFENSKNGTGAANSFSLTISFIPTNLFYKKDSVDFSDVNLIDKLLISASPSPDCTIRYGYSFPKIIKSPVYTGKIIDYSVEISNGALTYTITGYSSVTEVKDLLISREAKETPMKPTAIVKEVYEEYLSDSGYSLEFSEDTEDTDLEITVDAVSETNVMDYIKTLLDQAQYSNDTEETTPEERSLYYYSIEDIEGNKKITVSRLDKKANQLKVNEDSTVRFTWMGNSGEDNYSCDGMVIDFKTNYKGAVAMSFNYSSTEKNVMKYGIDGTGAMVKSSGVTTSPVAGLSSEQDGISDLNLWSRRLQFAYTATLTTLGIPCEISILDNVYIAPMMYGQEHHTGGLYIVTKITDVIDSSGFITTLELCKNQASTLDDMISSVEEQIETLKQYGGPQNSHDGNLLHQLNKTLADLKSANGE